MLLEKEILIAVFSKMVEEKISSLPAIHGLRGARGFQGPSGIDGKDGLPGAEGKPGLPGSRGKDGRDGKDFDFSENSADIKKQICDEVKASYEELKLKFADLSADDIAQLRGPAGRDGKDGVDGQFNFEDHSSTITQIIESIVEENYDRLRLKFSDLSADDIGQLRGPRGRDGNDGRDFNFDEHREFFNSLRLKFSDLSDEERDSLKLRFSNLSEEEKSSLKLRFKDLTQDDLALIRGPRGSRGQRGSPGKDGDNGKMGPRGLPGLAGISGLTGARGRDGLAGVDGKDAPHVVAIDIEETGDEIEFVFKFSDGSEFHTDRVKLPDTVVVQGGGGGRGSRGMKNYETRIDEVSDSLTYVGKALPGSDNDQEVWQIQKITVTGTETAIEFADGDSLFDNIWDNRLSLIYT